MGKAGAARKLASAAAYGGGGLSVVGAALYGILTFEANSARRVIGEASSVRPPDPSGWYGRSRLHARAARGQATARPIIAINFRGPMPAPKQDGILSTNLRSWKGLRRGLTRLGRAPWVSTGPVRGIMRGSMLAQERVGSVSFLCCRTGVRR